MPKAKVVATKKRKQESSDEENSASDSASESSGPEDRNLPPGKKGARAPKKPAAAAPAKKTTATLTQTGDEKSWTLDTKRFVKVRSFKGNTSVDIREYYEKDGALLPGKKGISLTPAQWNKLKASISEIDEALGV